MRFLALVVGAWVAVGCSQTTRDVPLEEQEPRADGGAMVEASIEAPIDASPSACSTPDAFEPLVPREGETCYELRAHEHSDPLDTRPFIIPSGESYSNINYAVPWPADTVATRIGLVQVNKTALVHGWLFALGAGAPPDGTVEHDVTGTFLFQDAQLISAWSIGGCTIEMPADVGLRLPDPDKSLAIQWHHLNHAIDHQLDGSIMQICTVPKASREHIAGITLLGTDSFNGSDGIPTGEHSFESLCPNVTDSPVTILGALPHMHRIGRGVALDIMRASSIDNVLDVPAEFEHHVNYAFDPRVVVNPGESVRTTCRYDNDTGNRVLGGPSAWFEMCTSFVFAYPAGALDQPNTTSLLGATNTCYNVP